MKKHPFIKIARYPLSLAVCLCAGLLSARVAKGQTVSSTAPTQAPERHEPSSTQTRSDTPEKEEDRQHLRRIYKALWAYYRDHHDLPDWLSDLVPKYLPDPHDLISPVETRTGKSVLYGRTDPHLRTSYIYEFNAGPAPEEFNRGRAVPLTCKQWKLMQLEKFGLVTPILRCHLHNPVLNVAYGGQLYETGLLWETDPRTAALIQANPALEPKASTGTSAVVNVRVVDADTAAPVPGASTRSTLGSEFGLLPPGTGITDTNGAVAFKWGTWQANFLIVSVTHPLYAPAQFEWNRENAPEQTPPSEVEIKLQHYPPSSSR